MPNLATHQRTTGPHTGLPHLPGVATLGVGRATLDLGLTNGEPPAEFRLFVSGWNDTEKGQFLFDAEAAQSVMDAYRTWGVDLAIDLEHQMLECEIPADPTARDARGWCGLEVRPDGSLWAINVQWTEDGAARLKGKRQRYISPAFSFDMETRQVLELTNIALVSMPATRGTPALMSKKNKARDLRKLSAGPSFGDISTAVGAALNERFPRVEETDEYAWVVDIFDASMVYQFKGDLFEVSYSYDGKTAVLGSDAVEVTRTYAPVASPAPAPLPIAAAPVVASQNPVPEAMSARAPVPATITLAKDSTKMDPSLAKQIFDVLKKADAKGALKLLEELFLNQGLGVSASEPAADPAESDAAPADGADAAAPPAAEEMATALSKVIRLTAAHSFAEMAEQVETFRASHVELAAERAALAKERAVLETAKRVKLGKDLVSLAGEHPARVWADDKCEALKGPLAKMSIADLEEFVADAIAAKPQAPAIRPPVSKATVAAKAEQVDANGLTPAQLAICAEYGTDPAVFAALSKRSNPTA